MKRECHFYKQVATSLYVRNCMLNACKKEYWLNIKREELLIFDQYSVSMASHLTV